MGIMRVNRRYPRIRVISVKYQVMLYTLHFKEYNV